MTAVKIGNVVLDECQQCRGLWFDKKELEEAKDEVDPDLRWLDFDIWHHEAQFNLRDEPLKCPRCSSTAMQAVNYQEPDINFTFCPYCEGVWLEAGHFKNIIDALNEEAANKSVSEYVKASLNEATEIFTNPSALLLEWQDLKVVLRMLRHRVFVENPKFRSILIGIQKSLPL
jgi:Zn-finger nucleic acid-binding protein